MLASRSDSNLAEKINARRDELGDLSESDLPCAEIAQGLLEIANEREGEE